MTDDTQPEALRLAEQYDHGDPAAHGNAWKAAVCTELRRQHARIAELESELEAVGAGGVQSLSAAPPSMYVDGAGIHAEDGASAVIRKLDARFHIVTFKAVDAAAASPTPPAEQQAATKAAPGGPFDECFPGEPRVAVPQGLIGAACFAIRNKRDDGKVLEQLRRYSVGDLSQPLAPQQEAQEPVAWLNPWRADQVTTDYDAYGERGIPLYTAPQPAPADLEQLRERIARMGLDVDRAMRGHVNEQSPLGTQRLAAIAALVKPKPAPPSDDVVKDAARYRFLAGHCRSTSEHWGGRWSIVVDGPAPKSHDSEDDFDEAVDAALAAQGGK